MHSRENVQAVALQQRSGVNANVKDKRLLVVNGTPQLEYDGLHQGELAWILGRRFKSAVNPNQGQTADGIAEFTEMERYAHQAFAGLGSGVDRMQRLASTAWVESLFEERLGSASIKLHKIRLDAPYAKAMDSGLLQFSKYLAGANVLHCPDIAWWRAQLEGTTKALAAVGNSSNNALPNEGRRSQGINLMDSSPFLRGLQVDSKVVRFDDTYVLGSTIAEDLARNQGDLLSMAALETELRRRNIMDWTPDGIVLSKLESPTDEPMRSTEMDARQAQLFNVGVQGPSITKSWTSDVKNFRLEVQPMDKVFVVVVATLSYRISGDGNADYQTLRDAQQTILVALVAHRTAIKTGQPQAAIDAAKLAVDNAVAAANAAALTFEASVDASDEPEYDQRVAALKLAQAALGAVPAGTNNDTEKAAVDRAQNSLNDLFRSPTAKEVNSIRAQSELVRKNRKAVSKANLTNFRLMRTTSSHMSNFSYYKPGDEHSRLGLKLGRPLAASGGGGAANNFSAVQEVIVGGWCVGTVIDSAASRSTIGFQTVKSHPTSMAININVNVQWWSGDKLYKHYHDAGGLTMMRGMKRDYNEATGVPVPKLEEDTDTLPEDALAGNTNQPTVAANVDGHEDNGPFIPPMEQRSIRPRTGATGAAGSSGASAFRVPASGASGGARARPGGSRRA
jgi:hypothetical protein